jgi:chromosomal replication initiator protein
MREEVTIVDREIVSALMDSFADKIGKERFDLWFGDGAPWEIHNSVLKIWVTDGFRLDRARGFRRELQLVCETLTGRALELEFDVEPPNADSTNQPSGRTGTGTAIDDVGTDDDGTHVATTHVATTHVATTRVATTRVATTRVATTRVATTDDINLGRGKAGRARSATAPWAATANGGPENPTPHSRFQFDPTRPRKREYRDLSSLVVGEANRMAIVSAQRVLRRPGEATPFLLYGPSGSGKTHILDAIRGEARRMGLRRVVMQTAEQFTSSFVEAIQGAGLPSFRSKYRDVAILILDDVQFFAGKRATLVELQHTFDSLIRDGRQIVLSSDRPPSELASLPQELRARLTGGLVADVSPPDFAMRCEMLDRWESARPFSKEVKQLVAKNVNGDARRLSGAINRLQVAAEAYNCEITVELAQRSLRDLFQAHRPVIGLRDIQDAVCETFGVDKECLHSGRRDRMAAHPRMLAMWLARKHTRAGLAEIGRFFGKRSHSTVISADKKVQSLVGEGGSVETSQGPCHVEDAIARVERRLQAG